MFWNRNHTYKPLNRNHPQPRLTTTRLVCLLLALSPILLLTISLFTYLRPSSSYLRPCLPFSLHRLSPSAHRYLSCENTPQKPTGEVSTVMDVKGGEAVPDVQDGMSRLGAFLVDQREAFLGDLREGKGKGWTVVMGNEAGDLDSLASSIAYSYLSSTLLAERMIPLALTPSSQMRLRPENLLVFNRISLPLTSLLHPENLPPSPSPNTPPTASLTPAGVHFALVDHNRLLPIFGDGVVDGIIDHHEDEGAHANAGVRVIQVPTGSCASLVVKQFRKEWEASISGPAGVRGGLVDSSSLAGLLFSAILIDTAGLKVGGKGTKTDYEAAEFLYPLTGLGSGDATTNFAVGAGVPSGVSDYTKELFDTKFNVEGMSTHDLLLRDYKEYVLQTSSDTYPVLQVGLSTVPLGLKGWLETDGSGWKGYMEKIDGYMQERGIDVEGVLTSYQSEKKDKHKREMLLVVRSGGRIPTSEKARQVLEELSRGLEASGEVLGLGEWKKKGLERFLGKKPELDDGKKGRWARVWQQGNAKATRKQVAPIIRDLVAKLE